MTFPEPTPRHAGLLEMQGPDAARFAHAQFTSDVLSLETGAWQWSAWLDARGRVQNLLQLARIDDQRFIAVLRGGSAATMAERLQRFVFRSRVTLSALPSRDVGTGVALPEHRVRNDEDKLQLGFGDRSMHLPSALPYDPAWRLDAIRNGEPWLPDDGLGIFLPPALALRRLGALSLDKGCYPGQEIAARLHYRGGHKHVLVHAHADRCMPCGVGNIDLPGVSDPGVHVLDCMPVEDAFEVLMVVNESLAATLSKDEKDRAAPLRVIKIFS